MNIIEKRISLPNITLNIAFSDNENGKPILLLHGYPDAWFGWRKVMKQLIHQGFRVIVPDQRGYNLSDKPKGIPPYSNHNLIQDALDLMTSFGYTKFDLAGHDFGAYIAYLIGLTAPNQIKKLIVISGLHPTVFKNLRQISFRQWLKSWYLTFFHLPKIPEKLMEYDNFKYLFYNHSRKLTITEKKAYQIAWTGSVECMINWYRTKPKNINNPYLQMPVLILWGENDLYLTMDSAKANLNYCLKGKLTIIKNGSHWLMLENEDEVVKEMIDFLS